jgi:hypothetical protein
VLTQGACANSRAKTAPPVEDGGVIYVVQEGPAAGTAVRTIGASRSRRRGSRAGCGTRDFRCAETVHAVSGYRLGNIRVGSWLSNGSLEARRRPPHMRQFGLWR